MINHFVHGNFGCTTRIRFSCIHVCTETTQIYHIGIYQPIWLIYRSFATLIKLFTT